MSHIPVVQGVAVPSNQVYGNEKNQQPYVSAASNQQSYVPAASSNPHQPYMPAATASPAEHYNYGGQQGYYDSGGSDFNGVKGEVQPKQYQDVLFAVLFIVHLLVMVVVLSMFTAAGGNAQEDGDSSSYGGVVGVVTLCGLFAIGLSTLALGFMMRFAKELVKMALIFSIGCSLVVGLMGLLAGQVMMAILGFASFAIGICYAYFVWSRIPFAAANLNTALRAVKANLGLAVVAYTFLAIAFGWSILWSVGLGGAINSIGTAVLYLFLVSYYWTQQVLQNTVHVTVAGVIGTWWFVPDDASSFWSSAIKDSFVRATTYSFGSICFGSLLVALVQALRTLRHMLQDNDDFSFLVCIVDCILACIQGIIEYLNKWAYVYVGLYGYSYIEAGKNVFTLFQNKGWTVIISDDLAENVLFMVSVGIGLATGLVGLVLGSIDGNLFAGVGYENAALAGFVIGLLVGYLFASILMSVVGSAVNTVIVCFAEAPAEFEANHPQLSAEMREAWVTAWPMECRGL